MSEGMTDNKRWLWPWVIALPLVALFALLHAMVQSQYQAERTRAIAQMRLNEAAGRRAMDVRRGIWFTQNREPTADDARNALNGGLPFEAVEGYPNRYRWKDA